MFIAPVQIAERQALLDLAVKTGLFTLADADVLLGGVLDSLASGGLPQGHAAVACRAVAEGPILGWSYFAPDPYAEGVYNVWWIGADPAAHGRGVGDALLTHVEDEASNAGARVVVIETSDQPALARARAFYGRNGYTERGRIPDFYARNDAKVIFSRSLGE